MTEIARARLADVLAALTLAMDLGLGLPIEWVLRCTLTGMRLTEAMGLGDETARDVYYFSLLRHIGCTSMASEFAHFFGTDLIGPEIVLSDPKRVADNLSVLAGMGAGQPVLSRMGAVARAIRAPSIEEIDAVQCDAACRLAEAVGIDSRLIDRLRQSRERWDGKGSPNGLLRDQIDVSVRIAYVAQDLVLTDLLFGGAEGNRRVRERAGRILDPDIVSHIDEVEVPAPDEPVWDDVLAVEPKPAREIDLTADVLGAFADFADLKSTFLLGHSRRVSALATAAAGDLGLSPAETNDVRLAGLVHDLGRVAVSTAIWDKPAALTTIEVEQVRLHPYYTERILDRSSSLSRLTPIASSHHECTDGSGYHRGVKGPALPIAARVVAAADTYSALTEPRPHRFALRQADAAAELRSLVASGKLDGDATDSVLAATGVPTGRPSATKLTSREIEVLRLAARGSTIREIALDLVISPKTADRHVQNLYTKLGISNRAAAAIWAMEHGLL